MKTEPMKHQVAGLEASKGKRNFAFFMEQGTGKTWLTLADGERCYINNMIDGMLVLAPKGVHTNWALREIPTHLSIETQCYIWRGKPGSNVAKKRMENFFEPWRHATKKRPLQVLVMNIDAINTKDGYDLAARFLGSCRVMAVVDESTRIKNNSAVRTKKAIALGKLAIARRILSGTPMPKAPSDLFSQFQFLKKGLLGTTSYPAFVAEYTDLIQPHEPEMIAIMRNSSSKFPPQIARRDDYGRPIYRNLDQLVRMMQPHCFRVKKDDCLDLPPKSYKPVFFEMSSKQRQVYRQLEEEYSYLFTDSEIGVEEEMSFAAIAARTKMKQVTSGFINIFGDAVLMEPSDNPRMKMFKEKIEDLEELEPGAQMIVWAMFDQEIQQVIAHLESVGISARAYTGATKQAERDQIIDAFQKGEFQVFVGNAAAGGIGITLTAAHYTHYYSCSFDNELRMQSEDRNHRIGTKQTVTYFDYICEDSIDMDILRNLDHKNKTAAQVIDALRQ